MLIEPLCKIQGMTNIEFAGFKALENIYETHLVDRSGIEPLTSTMPL